MVHQGRTYTCLHHDARRSLLRAHATIRRHVAVHCRRTLKRSTSCFSPVSVVEQHIASHAIPRRPTPLYCAVSLISLRFTIHVCIASFRSTPMETLESANCHQPGIDETETCFECHDGIDNDNDGTSLRHLRRCTAPHAASVNQVARRYDYITRLEPQVKD